MSEEYVEDCFTTVVARFMGADEPLGASLLFLVVLETCGEMLKIFRRNQRGGARHY
jgi:hypothetical protein